MSVSFHCDFPSPDQKTRLTLFYDCVYKDAITYVNYPVSDLPLIAKESLLILPRFDGVGKGGIYNSIKGEQDGKATENLHPRVQSGGGAARQGQRQTDEPGSARARDQRQCPVEVVQ